MHNIDLRRNVAGAGLRLWQLAQALGIPDSSLSRKLRRELPDSERERILAIIEKLKGEGNASAQ